MASAVGKILRYHRLFGIDNRGAGEPSPGGLPANSATWVASASDRDLWSGVVALACSWLSADLWPPTFITNQTLNPDQLEKMLEASVRIVVPFHDVDAAQIVWHGNYLKYFSQAAQALVDKSGVDLFRLSLCGTLMYPVIRSSVKHIRPLRFRDEIECSARVTDATHKLAIAYRITKVSDGSLCATGTTEQAAVRIPDGALEFSLPAEVQRAFSGEKYAR